MKRVPGAFRAVSLLFLLPCLGLPARADEAPSVPGTRGALGTAARVEWREMGAQPGSPPASGVIPFNALPRGGRLRGQAREQRFRIQGPVPPPTPPPKAPTELAGFEALGDNNALIPPDTMGAAGPNHLLVALNTQVRIQNKTGAEQSVTTLSSFWSLVATFPFDPKVYYDEDTGRFIFVAMNEPESTASSVLLGVSDTSDPTGSWCLRSFDADPLNFDWADYPSVGFNQKWIAVSAIMFSISTSAFNGAKMWVFNKSDVMGSCGAVTPTLFNTGFDDQGFGSNAPLQPAVTYGAESELYLADSGWVEDTTGESLLRLSKITGSASSPSWQLLPCSACVSGAGYIVATNHDSFSLPGAPQKDTSNRIDTNDDRVLSAVFRNGRLWLSHSGGLPSSSPSRVSSFWYEIDPAGAPPVMAQKGVVDDAAGTFFYWFPSISVDPYGNAAMGFSGSSAGTYAGAYYAGRRASDSANTMSAPVLAKAGEAKYHKLKSGASNRWGDYSATMTDPSNGAVFWTIQQYAETPANAGSDGDRWGTWWTKFSMIPTLAQGPSGFAVLSLGLSSVSWTWNALVDADSYTVRYATNPSVVIATVTATAYTLTGLAANTVYQIEVRGVNPIGEGPGAVAPSTATVAKAVTSASFTPHLSSITVTYATRPASPPEESCAGYALEVSESPSFAGAVYSSATPSSAQSSLAVGGLIPDATYYMRLATLSVLGAVNFVSLGSTLTVTLPVVPGTAPASNLTTTSLTANWTRGDNKPGIQYAAEASTAPNFTGSVSSAQTSGFTAAFQGLSPNTTYYLRVRPLGGPNADLDPAVTLANVPAAASPAFPAVDRTSATVSWSSNGNPGGTLFLAEVSSSAAFASGVLSSATRNTTALFTALDANTDYHFRAYAVNHAGVQTAATPAVSTSTLANPPALASPTFLPVTFTSVTVQWTPLPASPQALSCEGYRLELSPNAQFSGKLSIVATTDPTVSKLGVDGLSPDTIYYLRVGSLNPLGTPSYLVLGATRTLAVNLSSRTFNNSTPLIVSIMPNFPQLSSIQLDVPVGAFPSGTPIELNTSVQLILPDARSNQASLTPLGNGVGVDISANGAQPAVPVTITMVYDPVFLPAGADPELLAIARYDDGGRQWSLLPTDVNSGARRLSAVTNHLSLFAPFLVAAASDLGSVQVFPVPWERGSGSQFDAAGLTFTSLPPGAKVTLYSILGESLWTADAPASGLLAWDGATKRGQPVGSGTYLVVIEYGGSKLVKRVVVIR